MITKLPRRTALRGMFAAALVAPLSLRARSASATSPTAPSQKRTAPEPTEPHHVANKRYVDQTFASLPELASGLVAPLAAAEAPDGWLVCDGRVLQRSAYPDLFAAIGTTYGSTSINDFRIPDLRSRFVRGADLSRGLDAGRAFGSFQANGNGEHAHSITASADGGHAHSGSTNSAGSHSHSTSGAVLLSDFNDAAGGSGRRGGGARGGNTASAGGHTHTVNVVSSGAHSHSITTTMFGGTESRPPNMALLWCIKE